VFVGEKTGQASKRGPLGVLSAEQVNAYGNRTIGIKSTTQPPNSQATQVTFI